MSRESIILASPDRKPFQLEEISSSVDQQSIVQQSVSILPSPSRSPGIFSSELVTTVPDSDSLRLAGEEPNRAFNYHRKSSPSDKK